MNYLFLTKTAFFNGLSENEIKTILNCLGAYQKSFKESKRKTFRWSCDGNENNEDQRYDL